MKLLSSFQLATLFAKQRCNLDFKTQYEKGNNNEISDGVSVLLVIY